MRIVSLLLFFTIFLFAHKLNIFTTFENNNLFVNVYFANAKGCEACKITIKDMSDNIIKEGVTNSEGEYKTKIEQSKVKIVADASSGHLVFDEIENSIKKDINGNINELESENLALKKEIEYLKKRLEYMNIFKTILAISIIIMIFQFLKRVKG